MVVSIRQFLFDIAFLIICLTKLIPGIERIDNYFMLLASLILAFKIYRDGFTKKELLGIIACVLPALGCLFIAREANVLSVVMLIVAMKGIDIKREVKLLTMVSAIIFLTVFLLSKIGVLYDDIYYFSRIGEIIIRHSYGFKHPNQMFLRYFIILILFIYIMEDNLKLKHIVLTMPLSCFMYAVNKSRTCMICVVILYIAIFILKYGGRKINKLMAWGFSYACIINSIISGIMLFIPKESPLLIFLDRLFTGRIYLMQKYFEENSATILGSPLASGIVIDNSYIYMLTHYGIVIILCYIIATAFVSKRCYKYKNYYALCIIGILHIYALMENILVSSIFNITFLFIGSMLYAKSLDTLSYDKQNQVEAI